MKQFFKGLSAALACALVLSTNFATANTSAPFDPAIIEQAKRDAAKAGGPLGKQEFQIDANGNPVLDADGKPVLKTTSSQGMRDNLRMFQGITGVQSVDTVSSPGSASKTGKAKVNINQAFEFQCQANMPSALRYGAGSLAFKVNSCTMSNGTVQSVDFAICDNAVYAGNCGVESDFKNAVRVTANTFGSFNGLEIGLGCASNAKCRVTVKGAYEIGGSDQSMKADAAVMGNRSTAVTELRKMVTEQDYGGKMTEIGKPLVDCANMNAQSGATGQYATCDGKQTTSVATPQNNNTCSTTRECIKEAVSSTTFKRTCVRTFPLTERFTQTTITKKAECVVTTFETGQGTNSNSCKPEGGTDETAGMVKVGQGERLCIKHIDVKDSDSKCVGWSQPEYWANVQDTQKQVTESPAKVDPTLGCDNNQFSGTLVEQCTGGWFGRSLSEDACIGNFQDAEGEQVGYNLSYSAKAGCGVCLSHDVRQTCYAVPAPFTPGQGETDSDADVADSCGGIDLTGCSLSGKTALTFSDGAGGGLVTAQRETYSCTKERRQCVQWSATGSDPSCLNSDMAMGMDRVSATNPTADGSMNNAMVAAALLDGTAQGAEGEQKDQKVPLLFNGEDMRCKRPVGGIGSLLSKNCCRTNLERPKKGVLIQKGCDMTEAKLAAARRSNYAHYVGEYCSRRMGWPFKKCLERKQTYCVFQGVLPRLIHEQGRDQLAAMTASSGNASVKEQQTTFRYYHSGDGAWSTPVEVNGVKVSAWQWPSYCSDPAKAAEKLVESQNAKECSGVVTTWFAACDSVTGCGPLPAEPEEGSLDWTLKSVDPLENLTTAISKYAVVTGACSPSSQDCRYNVAAWPVGIGGKAVVTKDLTWVLYSEETQGAQAQGAAAAPPAIFQLNNIGDLMFKMYSVTGKLGTALPATVRLGFSRDGGQTWVDVNLPTTSLKSSEMTLPGSDARITGHCDSSENVCGFRVTGTVTVTAKPWGSAQAPECSGFTAGQLAMLDFSKMDLSEWLATVMDKVGGGNPQALAAQASSQFQSFNALFQSGQVQGSAPVAANFARVVPAEGFGPVNVRLAVSAYWPEFSDDPARNTEKVTKVDVDWGDCSPQETLGSVTGGEGQGYRGLHTYLEPNADKHACLKTNAADKLERNLAHKIKLAVYTMNSTGKSAKYDRVLTVENAWAKFPGGNSNNDYVKPTTTVNTPGSGNPPPPRP